MWLDRYGLICLKLPNAALFVLRPILPSRKMHFSKASKVSSILISMSAALPVNTRIGTAQGSPITYLETADLRLCTHGDHLKSFKLPEDKCFFYSSLSCKNACAEKDLSSWFIISISDSFSLPGKSREHEQPLGFAWSFKISYGLDGLVKKLLS